MTKQAAIQGFFDGFMTSYPAENVPSDVTFPYLTYTSTFGSIYDGEMSMSVDLWFYTESESVPNAKVQELSSAIGGGGVILPCDNGAIWLKRGNPWCRSIKEDIPNVKRRFLNIAVEFLTAD